MNELTGSLSTTLAIKCSNLMHSCCAVMLCPSLPVYINDIMSQKEIIESRSHSQSEVTKCHPKLKTEVTALTHHAIALGLILDNCLLVDRHSRDQTLCKIFDIKERT